MDAYFCDFFRWPECGLWDSMTCWFHLPLVRTKGLILWPPNLGNRWETEDSSQWADKPGVMYASQQVSDSEVHYSPWLLHSGSVQLKRKMPWFQMNLGCSWENSQDPSRGGMSPLCPDWGPPDSRTGEQLAGLGPFEHLLPVPRLTGGQNEWGSGSKTSWARLALLLGFCRFVVFPNLTGFLRMWGLEHTKEDL